MYGKHFASMYEGSMYGAGPDVFAVWGYAISHTKNSRVELNPKLVAGCIGTTPERVEEAIEKLCSRDPDSRNKEYDGRKLIREGQYQYFLPSWEIYRKIANEDERRTYNADAQKKHRERIKKTVESSPHYEDALKIYALYPRKVSKPDAIKAIVAALEKTPVEQLVKAVTQYADAVSRWSDDQRQYIPHPSTWFNQERYNDDPATWERNGRHKSSADQRRAEERKGDMDREPIKPRILEF